MEKTNTFDYTTEFEHFVDSIIAEDSHSTAAAKAAMPASSVAAKAVDVAKNMVSESDKANKKPATAQKTVPTERTEVHSVAPAPKKSATDKVEIPKKIVSDAQQKTSEVGQRVRTFAKEKKSTLKSGLEKTEDRLNAFIDKLDAKIRGN
jgi:phage protein D